jgi:hypothetical protein
MESMGSMERVGTKVHQVLLEKWDLRAVGVGMAREDRLDAQVLLDLRELPDLRAIEDVRAIWDLLAIEDVRAIRDLLDPLVPKEKQEIKVRTE